MSNNLIPSSTVESFDGIGEEVGENSLSKLRSSLASALAWLDYAYCLSYLMLRPASSCENDKFTTSLMEIATFCGELIDEIDEMMEGSNTAK